MIFTTYVTVTYVISLRGLEGCMLDLKSLRDLMEKARENHLWLGLLGKLKGENVEGLHTILFVNITSSGINVLAVIILLINKMELRGRLRGLAISDTQ